MDSEIRTGRIRNFGRGGFGFGWKGFGNSDGEDSDSDGEASDFGWKDSTQEYHQKYAGLRENVKGSGGGGGRAAWMMT